jgi:hypothetical protein
MDREDGLEKACDRNTRREDAEKWEFAMTRACDDEALIFRCETGKSCILGSGREDAETREKAQCKRRKGMRGCVGRQDEELLAEAEDFGERLFIVEEEKEEFNPPPRHTEAI